ncbi:MAG: radical SAM protein, partial [Pseudomonadota bacterium]
MKTVRKPDADRTYQPRYAAIEITNRCNLRCLHCASDSGSARDNEMTTEEIITVIDELKRLGAEEITLMGGELFLHDEWDAMAAHVVENSMKLIVISNGLLMTEKKMRRLVDLDPYIIAISIDGATPETYRRIRGVDGFGKAMDALRALAGTGHPLVNAVTCFNRANFSEFDDFVSLFRGTPITWQVQLAGKGGSRFPDELFFTKDDYRAYVRKVLDLVSTADDPGVALMDDFGYFPLDPKFDSSAKWNACVCKWAGCQGGLRAI